MNRDYASVFLELRNHPSSLKVIHMRTSPKTIYTSKSASWVPKFTFPTLSRCLPICNCRGSLRGCRSFPFLGLVAHHADYLVRPEDRHDLDRERAHLHAGTGRAMKTSLQHGPALGH